MDTAVVTNEGQAAAAAGLDFVERLGPDASAIIFALIRETTDLANASAVSRSWRTLVMVVHLTKIQCLRLCPEIGNFTGIEESTTSASGSSSGIQHKEVTEPTIVSAMWENHKRERSVYLHLVHDILSLYTSRALISRCIGASSTDNFPHECIQNTLMAGDRWNFQPCYWSSKGKEDPGVPEYTLYMLCSDLCLVDEIRIQPFEAYFQRGQPIYSAQCVRFSMGHPKNHVQLSDAVSQQSEGQVTAEDNYIWTYTSPKFPMLQDNVIQIFKLPRPVLCIGGVVKVEFLGRIQKQEADGRYYICMSHVQVLGKTILQQFGVVPRENGLALKYLRDHKSPVIGDRSLSSEWNVFEARLWLAVKYTGQGTGMNKELLSRLLGPSMSRILNI